MQKIKTYFTDLGQIFLKYYALIITLIILLILSGYFYHTNYITNKNIREFQRFVSTNIHSITQSKIFKKELPFGVWLYGDNLDAQFIGDKNKLTIQLKTGRLLALDTLSSGEILTIKIKQTSIISHNADIAFDCKLTKCEIMILRGEVKVILPDRTRYYATGDYLLIANDDTKAALLDLRRIKDLEKSADSWYKKVYLKRFHKMENLWQRFYLRLPLQKIKSSIWLKYFSKLDTNLILALIDKTPLKVANVDKSLIAPYILIARPNTDKIFNLQISLTKLTNSTSEGLVRFRLLQLINMPQDQLNSALNKLNQDILMLKITPIHERMWQNIRDHLIIRDLTLVPQLKKITTTLDQKFPVWRIKTDNDLLFISKYQKIRDQIFLEIIDANSIKNTNKSVKITDLIKQLKYNIFDLIPSKISTEKKTVKLKKIKNSMETTTSPEAGKISAEKTGIKK